MRNGHDIFLLTMLFGFKVWILLPKMECRDIIFSNIVGLWNNNVVIISRGWDYDLMIGVWVSKLPVYDNSGRLYSNYRILYRFFDLTQML